MGYGPWWFLEARGPPPGLKPSARPSHWLSCVILLSHWRRAASSLRPPPSTARPRPPVLSSGQSSPLNSRPLGANGSNWNACFGPPSLGHSLRCHRGSRARGSRAHGQDSIEKKKKRRHFYAIAAFLWLLSLTKQPAT